MSSKKSYVYLIRIRMSHEARTWNDFVQESSGNDTRWYFGIMAWDSRESGNQAIKRLLKWQKTKVGKRSIANGWENPVLVKVPLNWSECPLCGEKRRLSE